MEAFVTAARTTWCQLLSALGLSAVLLFTVSCTSLNGSSVPAITSMNPAAATAGSTAFVIQIQGDHLQQSTVLWNGVACPTTVVNANLVQATVPSSLVVQAGTARVAVFQKSTFLVSNALTFIVANGGSASSTSAPLPLVVSTTSLPNGITGSGYSTTLTAVGGVTPYGWSVASGSLPTGLLLSTSGAISGTPTQAGQFSFVAKVTDSSPTPQVALQSLTVSIVQPTSSQSLTTLNITTASLPAGTLSSAYSAALAASGGTTPYNWSVASGSLPTGLVLGSSGSISGTPTQSGQFSFTVKVSDSSTTTQIATKSLGISVGPATLVSLAVSPTSQTLLTGATQQYVATCAWSDGSTSNCTNSVSWASSSPAIATTNSTGLATAVAAGTATISAAQSSINNTAVLTVTSGSGGGTSAAPVITATAKGPNQINLTWSQVSNPGYGYCVEIQSNADSRYSSFSQLNIWPEATNLIHQAGQPDETTVLTYTPPIQCLPYWVTEAQYTDPQDGTPAQYIAVGLRPNTTYNFRVRSYSGYSGTAYSSYSNTVTATTANYIVRYATASASGSGDGTSIANAWTLGQANSNAVAGQVVIFETGTYNGSIAPSNGGSNAASKLVFMADAGATVTLNGTATLTHNYTVIDGIHFVGPYFGNNSPYISGNHNAMVNTESNGAAVLCPDVGNLTSCPGGTQSYTPRLDTGASSTLLQGNYWHDYGADQGSGYVVEVLTDHIVSQYNHWTRGAHAVVSDTSGGGYNKHLNNIIDGGEGSGVYIRGSNPKLLEGNVIAYTAASNAFITAPNNNSGYPGVYKDAVGVMGQHVTMRRNLVLSGGISSNGNVNPNTTMGVEINGANQGSSPADFGLFYNNVFYGGGGPCFWWEGAASETYETVANNICYKQRGGNDAGQSPTPVPLASGHIGYSGAQDYLYLMMRGTFTGSLASYNDFLFSDPYVGGGAPIPAQPIICVDSGACGGYASSYKVATDNVTWPTNFINNLAVTPGFVNEGTDFHLGAGSALVGAGTIVNDSNWVFPASETDIGAFKTF